MITDANDLIVVFGINCFLLDVWRIMNIGCKVVGFWNKYTLTVSAITLMALVSYLAYGFIEKRDRPVRDSFKMYGKLYIIHLLITSLLVYLHGFVLNVMNSDFYGVIAYMTILIWTINIYTSI